MEFHIRRMRHQTKSGYGSPSSSRPLAVVTLTSIRTGPSADEAIVVIRLAQRELVQAQRNYRGAASSALNNAEAQLALAWAALKEERYEEAILEARKSIELTRKLAG